MKVVSVVGPSDGGKTTLVERLVDRLRTRGSVATVKHLTHPPGVDTEGTDTARHRAAGAAETVGITDEDGWFATGEATTLDDALDRFAPRFDYAVVEGFGASSLPSIALGGFEPDGGEVVQRATDAEAVDVEGALEAIDALDPYVTLETLVSRVKATEAAERSGAIATFTGRVREKDGEDDSRTTHLEFERYDEVAAERFAEIRADLEAREGVLEVRLHHRVGVVEAGEDIVFVVVLAGHRAEAFSAVEDGINRLKAEVPLFKREVTVEDSFWAHER